MSDIYTWKTLFLLVKKKMVRWPPVFCWKQLQISAGNDGTKNIKKWDLTMKESWDKSCRYCWQFCACRHIPHRVTYLSAASDLRVRKKRIAYTGKCGRVLSICFLGGCMCGHREKVVTVFIVSNKKRRWLSVCRNYWQWCRSSFIHVDKENGSWRKVK